MGITDERLAELAAELTAAKETAVGNCEYMLARVFRDLAAALRGAPLDLAAALAGVAEQFEIDRQNTATYLRQARLEAESHQRTAEVYVARVERVAAELARVIGDEAYRVPIHVAARLAADKLAPSA